MESNEAVVRIMALITASQARIEAMKVENLCRTLSHGRMKYFEQDFFYEANLLESLANELLDRI